MNKVFESAQTFRFLTILDRCRNRSVLTNSEWEPGIWMLLFLMLFPIGLILPDWIAWTWFSVLLLVTFRDQIRDLFLTFPLIRRISGGTWIRLRYTVYSRYGNRNLTLWERYPGHTFPLGKDTYVQVLADGEVFHEGVFSKRERKLLICILVFLLILFFIPYLISSSDLPK